MREYRAARKFALGEKAFSAFCTVPGTIGCICRSKVVVGDTCGSSATEATVRHSGTCWYSLLSSVLFLSSFPSIAGSGMLFNFNAIAKTMPVVTAVVCFLSTQNIGS
jgi:hypothetical protein